MAVGITSHTNMPTYKEMYSGKDDSRFTRRNAGQKFEFSTAGGKFILIAEMDGDSTLKPVLRVSLIPKDESLLGSNIRYAIFSHFDSIRGVELLWDKCTVFPDLGTGDTDRWCLKPSFMCHLSVSPEPKLENCAFAPK